MNEKLNDELNRLSIEYPNLAKELIKLFEGKQKRLKEVEEELYYARMEGLQQEDIE